MFWLRKLLMVVLHEAPQIYLLITTCKFKVCGTSTLSETLFLAPWNIAAIFFFIMILVLELFELVVPWGSHELFLHYELHSCLNFLAAKHL